MLHHTISVKGENEVKEDGEKKVWKSWRNLSSAYVCLLMIFSDCYKGKSIKSGDGEVFNAASPQVCAI